MRSQSACAASRSLQIKTAKGDRALAQSKVGRDMEILTIAGSVWGMGIGGLKAGGIACLGIRCSSWPRKSRNICSGAWAAALPRRNVASTPPTKSARVNSLPLQIERLGRRFILRVQPRLAEGRSLH
jgi:hypothetical protein